MRPKDDAISVRNEDEMLNAALMIVELKNRHSLSHSLINSSKVY